MNEQQKALVIQNDTLSILLCNQIHRFTTNKTRAIKISKCCKIIRDRTKDDILYNACRNVIKATTSGAYDDVVASINQTEINYISEYKSNGILQ